MAAAETELLRFYPVVVAPRKVNGGAGGSEVMDDGSKPEPLAQLWTIRIKTTERGRVAMKALEAIHTDGTLRGIMDAELRADRPPVGPMARALQESLLGSIE